MNGKPVAIDQAPATQQRWPIQPTSVTRKTSRGCSYHSHSAATVSCNGCGRPLCRRVIIASKLSVLARTVSDGRGSSSSAEPHRPCAVRQEAHIAGDRNIFIVHLSGFRSGYNGQTVKGLVTRSVRRLVSNGGAHERCARVRLGFIGMWFFAAVDSWRTASMIRSGLTPDVADDILVKRFSGNPRLWGIVLLCLGGGICAAARFQSGF